MWFFLVGINSSEDSLLRKLRGGGGWGAPTPDTAETPEAGAQPRTLGGKVLAGIAFGARPHCKAQAEASCGDPGARRGDISGLRNQPFVTSAQHLEDSFQAAQNCRRCRPCCKHTRVDRSVPRVPLGACDVK